MTEFGFRPGGSLLHRADVRLKLIFLMLVSVSGIRTGPGGLAVLTVVLLGFFFHIPLSVKMVLQEGRYFFLFLASVFAARALTSDGTLIFHWKIITFTWEGMREGGLICWRMTLAVLGGMCLIATTRPSEVRSAVVWFLKPIPLIPENRVGTMISLLVRFIPLIVNQAIETGHAQRARCVEQRKNPVRRLILFVIPLLRRIFEQADELTDAMEARCYSENRTDPDLSWEISDGCGLGFGIIVCLIMVFF